MIIFLLAAGIFIAGIVIGYRYCLYVHSSKRIHAKKQDRLTRLYNRAWGNWRKQQHTCSACSNIATFHCPNTDTYYCSIHWLATHQPIKNTKGRWRCEHLAHLDLGQQQMVCVECGKQYKLAEGQLARASIKPVMYMFGCDTCLPKLVAKEKAAHAVTGGST